MSNVILVGAVILFTVISQVILKIGQESFYAPQGYSGAEILKVIAINLGNWYVISCLIFTLLAGLAWLLVIQNMPLSRAYPFMSLNYVIMYFIAWMFFGEHLSTISLVGIALIMAGTSLLGFH